MFGLQIWLCMFMFRPMALIQFESLNSFLTSSCLGSPEVTHQTAKRDVPSSIFCFGKNVCGFCFDVVGVTFLFKLTLSK